jgi:hypothetical protein
VEGVRYAPIFWQFPCVGVDKEFRLASSARQYRGVAMVREHLEGWFAPLTDQGGPFFVIVIGAPERMMAVLAGFMEFVASHSFSRELSFVLIPRGRRSRLVAFLAEADELYRATANQVDDFLKGLNPQVSLRAEEQELALFTDPTYPGDPWTRPVSPYHILQRLFTFYCACASVVTQVPIWAVTLKFRGTSIVTGFLGSLVITQTKSLSFGNVRYQLFGFPGEYEPAVTVSGLTLVAFPLASELHLHTIADPTLQLSVKHPANFIEDRLVAAIRGQSKAPCDVDMDMVTFHDVLEFSVERSRHPMTTEAVAFPVRSFAILA